jgi:hypothetical protein
MVVLRSTTPIRISPPLQFLRSVFFLDVHNRRAGGSENVRKCLESASYVVSRFTLPPSGIAQRADTFLHFIPCRCDKSWGMHPVNMDVVSPECARQMRDYVFATKITREDP